MFIITKKRKKELLKDVKKLIEHDPIYQSYAHTEKLRFFVEIKALFFKQNIVHARFRELFKDKKWIKEAGSNNY